MMSLIMDSLLRVWQSMVVGACLNKTCPELATRWMNLTKLAMNFKHALLVCVMTNAKMRCTNSGNRHFYAYFRKYFTSGIKSMTKIRNKFTVVICERHAKIIFAHVKSLWQKNLSNWNRLLIQVSLPFMWVLEFKKYNTGHVIRAIWYGPYYIRHMIWHL